MSLLTWISDWVNINKDTIQRGLAGVAHHACGRLLDVGCGNKPYEPMFKPFVTEHVGVDYAETYEGSVYAANPKVDMVYSGDEIPARSMSFGTVLCTEVLEHTPNPMKLMAEMSRVLEPKGVLIATTPFAYRLHSEPYDFMRFTPYALTRMANDAGMDVVSIQPRGGLWHVVGQKISCHLTLHIARLGARLQEAGDFGYEAKIQAKPRYWTLPLVAPLVVLVVGVSRLLDRLFKDQTDTLGFVMVARKR